MKYLLIFLLIPIILWGQEYQNLSHFDNVYFSDDSEARASKISKEVKKAERYFKEIFKVRPTYALLVLNPNDWKKYAHPNAIYGIPHYLPDGRLVVASENNDFWRRNTPPLDLIPTEMSNLMKKTYTEEVNLSSAFDLLAVHELGHAFQNTAGMLKQRSWLNEVLCNLLLHTYLAEKSPENLQYITVYTQVALKTFPKESLMFTSLLDFEKNYNLIAQQHPDNYGWYQYGFHVLAGTIYDLGGEDVMIKLWNELMAKNTKLSDEDLMDMLNNAHPALKQGLSTWNK